MRVNYDTANVMFYGGVKPGDDLPAIMPFVAHVHLKDTADGRGAVLPRPRLRNSRLRSGA